jgi:UPF0176 protein
MYTVLLYYTYVRIDDPQELRDRQHALCVRLGLKGRILVAEEGLNGTVCGLSGNIAEYMKETSSDLRFSDMEFKEDLVDRQVFPRLRVAVRSEIVTLGVADVSAAAKAEYITPSDLNALMHSGEEYYLFDARNNYESKVGKFRDAITPDVSHFRELPEKLNDYAALKKKTVVTYCTGGVRCEKFSALLKKEGFEKVYQLHGGIVNYGREFPDDGWEGKLYVFDDRVTVAVNSPDKEVIVSTCLYCALKTARIINCANADCDEQYVCCESCEERNRGFCSTTCSERYIKIRPAASSKA